MQAARQTRRARVAQSWPDDGLAATPTPRVERRLRQVHRCGRPGRGPRMRRVRRRAAALAFSRWSSPLLLKYRLRLYSRRMPDLSMPVLKRRSSWSKDSPSRGSTCIRHRLPTRARARLRRARAPRVGIPAAHRATAFHRPRDQLHPAAPEDPAPVPRAGGGHCPARPARVARRRPAPPCPRYAQTRRLSSAEAPGGAAGAGALGAPSAAAVAAAAAAAALLKAVRAVDRLVATWLKRDLGLLAAARAGGAEHLASAPTGIAAAVGAVAATTPIPLGLAGGAAVGAAAWLGIAAAGIEVLLAAGEGERLTAVAAGESGVGRHDGRSLLRTERPAGRAGRGYGSRRDGANDATAERPARRV